MASQRIERITRRTPLDAPVSPVLRVATKTRLERQEDEEADREDARRERARRGPAPAAPGPSPGGGHVDIRV